MKKYTILLILILLLSFFLRVFRFENRVFIIGDGARDILVARGALQAKIIPQISSFSSTGPFVFGPHYYWLLMAVYFFSPESWSIFYYFLIFQSVFMVFILVKTGELICNKKFGLFLGLVAAVSPVFISRSTGIVQHAIMAFLAAISLYYFVKFSKRKRTIDAFWSGFWTAIAIMMHFQAMGLLVMSLAFFVSSRSIKEKVKNSFSYFLGLILPSASFIFWDAAQNFANARNFLDYVLIGQNRIYVANRWTWHIFKFWPEYAASLFGGQNLVGGIILYFALVISVFLIIRGKLNKIVKYLLVFFLFFYIYLRFYKGEKSEGYLAFIQPLTIIVMAYGFFWLARFKKLFFVVSTIIIFCTIRVTRDYYISQNVNEFQELSVTLLSLEKETGAKKFAIYDFADIKNQTQTWQVSDALAVFLGSVNKLDFENGYKIGLCQDYCPEENLQEVRSGFFKDGKNHLLLIGAAKKKFNLVARSPKSVMDEVIFWWKDRPLASPFNLRKYILEKI